MLKLNHNEKNLVDAFGISNEEKTMFLDTIDQLSATKNDCPASWAIQRLWIDERFSDNLRAFAIFQLGYSKCLQDLNGGEK